MHFSAELVIYPGVQMALLERTAQLGVLEKMLAESRKGRGGVAVVTGPVGIGKTELLRDFTKRASGQGAIVLHATASRTGRSVPLSVVGQLVADLDLPSRESAWAGQVRDAGMATTVRYESETGPFHPVSAPVLAGFATAVLSLSAGAPVLVAVDDVDVADVASLQCLLYLVSRITRARVLMVLNEAVNTHPWLPLHRAHLLRQPHCRQIRLERLSPSGVAGVLAENLDLSCARLLAPTCHRITGGNPLLVNALAKDCRTAGAGAAQVVFGDAFDQAVLSCLYRSEDTLLRLCRALAVLGESASPALVAGLADLDPGRITRVVEVANEVGLLDDCHFRHPRTGQAVLAGMTAREQADMHQRAARLLFDRGADAVAVARQEIAARRPAEPWAAPVLREAAERALEADDTDLALECLSLAQRGDVGEAERARIAFALVRTRWRVDPLIAQRQASDLVAAVRSGHLDSRDAAAVITYLTWYGRVREAIELLDRVDAAAAVYDLETEIALYSAELNLAFTYPGLSGRARARRPARLSAVKAGTARLRLATAALVESLLNDGLGERVASGAERALQQADLDDDTYPSILTALEILVFADRLDTAGRWCDTWLAEATERGAQTWAAGFSAVRSLISFRQGRIAEAKQYAKAALSHVPARGLGAFVGVPLSVLILAATRMGRYDAALTYLSTPVPPAMFQTRFGLHYLRARGHYYLAQGDHQAALADFELCRDLVLRWGLDVPGLAPWRTDLADAYREMGRGDRARQLTEEQNGRFGRHNAWSTDVPLRSRAAATELRQHTAILRAQGRPPLVGLSDSEWRVAELAAQGRTNREIARELYVTVSTVEQHLTRVYRKLKVRSRADLPVRLLAEAGKPAPRRPQPA